MLCCNIPRMGKGTFVAQDNLINVQVQILIDFEGTNTLTCGLLGKGIFLKCEEL